MKILTVWDTRNIEFDEKVNKAFEDGYTLVRREVLPDAKDLDASVFYAEMAKLDKSDAAPGKVDLSSVDPVALAEAIRAHCNTITGEECQTDRCPLAAYCDAIREGKTPEEWLTPGEGDE